MTIASWTRLSNWACCCTRSRSRRPRRVTRSGCSRAADRRARFARLEMTESKITMMHEICTLGQTVMRYLSVLSDSPETFLPHLIQRKGSPDIPQAVFRNLAILACCFEIVHVKAGDAVGFRRFETECLAIEIQVKSASGAIAAAHAIKAKLLGDVAVRLGLITVSQPFLSADWNIENCRT